jgi:signal recognition particle GTPase
MWEHTAVNGTLNVNDTYMIYDTMTGQRSQNSGNATILKGNRSVTIPHMLIGTPRIVIITGTDSETAGAYVSARNLTDITITVPNPVTVDSEIDWQAQV